MLNTFSTWLHNPEVALCNLTWNLDYAHNTWGDPVSEVLLCPTTKPNGNNLKVDNKLWYRPDTQIGLCMQLIAKV